MTTKGVAVSDALGNLVRVRPMPDQPFDSIGVAPLIDGVEFGASTKTRLSTATTLSPISTSTPRRSSYRSTHGAPSRFRSTRKCPDGALERKLLLQTHKVQRIAMRGCKSDQGFEGMICIAAAIINSR